MNRKPVVQARRKLIRSAIVLAGAAALPAMAQQKPASDGGMKIRTREEVGYRDEPYLGRNCARCVLYQGDGRCVILSEAVSANGWCKQWVPNTMG